MKDSVIILVFLVIFFIIPNIYNRIINKEQFDFSRKADKLIEECQNTIPRNKYCVIEMKAVIVPELKI